MWAACGPSESPCNALLCSAGTRGHLPRGRTGRPTWCLHMTPSYLTLLAWSWRVSWNPQYPDAVRPEDEFCHRFEVNVRGQGTSKSVVLAQGPPGSAPYLLSPSCSVGQAGAGQSHRQTKS